MQSYPQLTSIPPGMLGNLARVARAPLSWRPGTLGTCPLSLAIQMFLDACDGIALALYPLTCPSSAVGFH